MSCRWMLFRASRAACVADCDWPTSSKEPRMMSSKKQRRRSLSLESKPRSEPTRATRMHHQAEPYPPTLVCLHPRGPRLPDHQLLCHKGGGLREFSHCRVTEHTILSTRRLPVAGKSKGFSAVGAMCPRLFCAAMGRPLNAAAPGTYLRRGYSA